jgi:hypothetical protein
LECAELEGAWWANEVCCFSVDDGGDDVECFDDGAFSGVVFSDDEGALLEGDGVVAEAPVVLESERAQHCFGFSSIRGSFLILLMFVGLSSWVRRSMTGCLASFGGSFVVRLGRALGRYGLGCGLAGG